MSGDDSLRARIRAELLASRDRTLRLVDLPEEEQCRPVSPLMSPLVWDLAHIGNYEELWLLRALDGRPPTDETYDDLYDAFEHPRGERPSLPILGPTEARAYVASVRAEALDLLDRADLSPHAPDPLLREGFVYGLVVQHEHQHAETMTATHQLRGEEATPPPGAVPNPPPQPAPGDDLLITGGSFPMGTSSHPWAYDNERPEHEATVADFRLDRHPVTCDQYLRFVESGGYHSPEWWTEVGWAWRQEEGLEAPAFWRRGDRGWEVLRFGTWQELGPQDPVQHVCYWEADAYARWAAKRLPTEAEWEYAATLHPDEGKRRFPWGDEPPTAERANLGARHAGPSPVGSHPAGASPWGVEQLIGDVWEWTSSDFAGYPGFRSFPYKEYSEVFFGTDFKVLRGGSWAAHPTAVRGTFRNWDYPIRRQIFSGFRCAQDA